MSEPHITEPMTMVTDYLLALECVVLAGALWRRGASRRTVPMWLAAYSATALAALAGGAAHGFRLYLGPVYHDLVWNTTVVLLGISALLMINAGVQSVLRPVTADPRRRKDGHRWLWAAVGITLVGLAIQRSGWTPHRHFNYNDAYHIVQMAGLYCLYRGALALT